MTLVCPMADQSHDHEGLAYAAAIPSPPTAPGTTTLPTSVSVPAVTENSSTLPSPPACTYRNLPSGVALESTVPASLAVWPSKVSWPCASEVKRVTLPLPALEVNSCPAMAVTQQVADCPVSTASIWAMVPSECSAKVARALGPASVTARSPAGSKVKANGTV